MHRRLLVRALNEATLSFEAACGQGLGGVPREALLIDDDQVQLVFEEICASTAPMAIVDGEVAALGPGDYFLATRGLGHVEDDGDAILVVVPLNSLMCIGCIGRDQAVSLGCILGWLEILQWIDRWSRLRCVVQVHIEHRRRAIRGSLW